MVFYEMDPPYIGQSKKHYGNHPDYAGEVDHRELLTRADREADGWALHMSSTTLPEVLAILTEEVIEGWRVMAWVKPFAAFKPNVPVAYAWEPIIVKPVRKPEVSGRTVMRDWFSENITMRRGISGAKPERLCHWVFEVAGLHPTDTFVDVFPGSGAVQSAWDSWCSHVSETPDAPLDDRTSKLPVWAKIKIEELEARVGLLD